MISVRTHGVMYDQAVFYACKITGSDIRPHLNWAVSLVIADVCFIFLKGLCGYVWVNILTLSFPRVTVTVTVFLFAL